VNDVEDVVDTPTESSIISTPAGTVNVYDKALGTTAVVSVKGVLVPIKVLMLVVLTVPFNDLSEAGTVATKAATFKTLAFALDKGTAGTSSELSLVERLIPFLANTPR
jgi:hypothetical protein